MFTIKIKLSYIIQVLVSVIYLQTLYFKFSAHPDSVFIFTVLGLEPYGRIGLGVAELILAVMILVPRTKVIASLLSLILISGAIAAHLGPLGVVVQNDGGIVFILAIVVWLGSLSILVLNKNEIMKTLSNKTTLNYKPIAKFNK